MYLENSIDLIKLLLAAIITMIFLLNLSGSKSLFNINTKVIKLFLVGIFILILISYFGVPVIFNFLFILVILWAMINAFITSRKYLYGMTIILLSFSLITLYFGFVSIAEYLALVSFLFLALAVFKDLIYEKIFEN